MGADQHQRIFVQSLVAGLLCCGLSTLAQAQSVGLPTPRLLTIMPMGGQAGTSVTVNLGGEFLEDAEALVFTDPRITAVPAETALGQAAVDQFVVHIDAQTPEGLYEARVMTRLGVSSPRVFSVGGLTEVVRQQANTTLETALTLPLDSLCNAVMSPRAIDHYAIDAQEGQRILVDCAAQGIDSKTKPVIIIADATGNDLAVERRGGALDFTIPATGRYILKVHDLTFQGGAEYFYRLAIQQLAPGEAVQRLASTADVHTFSWPPPGLAAPSPPAEESATAQTITLPCDISGSFFPAADVDTFEFTAKKGEVWWVEVASERLGLPTDPSILVQHVAPSEAGETLTDVVELTDIASPVKPSTNFYSYDGPPYNAGSTDILGKLEIKQDGLHRLHLRDLFGGTRNDPRNVYRLIVRKAQPDFAIVGWALHMELRNGDRAALSKPISLRGGATMILEVLAIRRDGFAGPIELAMDNLPEGVTARGLRIPAGQGRGYMLLTAAESAPRGFSDVEFTGYAEIDGQRVERPGRLASMAWPVRDAWQEIPSPRLLSDVFVSVSGREFAPLTIAAQESKVWEVTQGEKLTIPLSLTRRSEFLGATTKLKTHGDGFERTPVLTLPLDKDATEVTLDLAAIKPPLGETTIAFYGSAVARYAHNPAGVLLAESALKQAQQAAEATAAEVEQLAAVVKTASPAAQAAAQEAAAAATDKHKAATALVTTLQEKLKQAQAAATPKDIVDIIVSEPISIRVNPAEAK
ncbi:MAG: serine protease [Planctomycetales bacterium]|nr:serine protease [Planctomycetales bacterium]